MNAIDSWRRTQGMRRMQLAAIILFALLLRVVYTGAVYGPRLDLEAPSDYWEYRRAANRILAGDWAFSDGVFLERPPLFPLMMAALDNQKPLILMLNQLLSLLVIPLTHILARQFRLPDRLALFCALFAALDPTSVAYAGILMAEPLANLLLALAFVSLLLARRSDHARAVVACGALAGACIALSAWTRPSAYLLWLPLALWLAFARRPWRLLALAAFVLPAVLGVGLWKAHNAAAYDNSNFSSVGTFNLLYHRAANALRLAQGQDDITAVHKELTARVAERLAKPADQLPGNWSEIRKYYRGITSAEESALAEIAMEIFLAHPLQYLATLPAGLFWILLPVYGALELPGIVWNVAALPLAAIGIWRLGRLRRWLDLSFLLLPSLYFLAAALLVCTNCIDTRARSMLTPLLAIMAAYGILQLLNRRSAKSAL